MSYGKQVTNFLRSRVGNFGISSLVLVVLEKMMDNDFVCPCQSGYNIAICFFYITVPSIVCFAFTLYFVDTEAEGPEDKECEAEGPEERRNLWTYSKVYYSLFIVLIWLFLFFIDGRYVSCACSHWGGEYAETGALKWCKPSGNETVVFERQQETQRCITESQFAGYIIALIALGLAIKCFRNDKYFRKGKDYKQAKAFIWLFLFFIDGRYVSCACSRWGGEYTETGALKWCKHNESETVAFENLQKTQRCITGSQFAGFAVAVLMSFLLAVAYCLHDCVPRCIAVPVAAQDS